MNPLLYTNYAKYYDIIYNNKDYSSEVDFILSNTKTIKGKKLLELACGTGSHTKEFVKRGFNVLGVDINEEMLTIAKEKNPGTKYQVGDFRNIELEGTFDLITLLFTSINYCTDISQVKSTFTNCKELLKKEGEFIFDLGLSRIRTKDKDEVFIDSAKDGSIEVARISQWRTLNSNRNLFKATYLTFIKNDKGIVDFGTDIHKLGAFDLDAIVDALQETGFDQINIYNGFKGDSVTKTHKFLKIPVIIASA